MQNIQSAKLHLYDIQLQFCKNITKRSQGKQERNVGGKLKKDSIFCIRVREMVIKW